MEIELKLALDPAHIPRLKRAPLLAGVKSARQVLHSIYYDTPDFALTRRRIALRTRRVGYHWVQTVKAAAPSVGALSARPEWEMQVVDKIPDLTILPAAAQALFAGLDLAGLAPVFATTVRRTTWQLTLHETAMEIALDQGQVVAGDRQAEICELEIELKAGPQEALMDAALALLDQVPLRIDSRSKAAIGYQLAGVSRLTPAKAASPQLRPTQAAGQAWSTLLAAALTQLVDNLPGFLEQPDEIEFLHQLRVALRRLLSLARLLDGEFPAWAAPFRALMGRLNPARDWDVFMLETLPRLNAPADSAFLACAGAAAQAARQAAQAALTGADFTRAVLNLGRALTTPPQLDLGAAAWAARVLDQRLRTLRRQGDKLAAQPNPVNRHRLRIAVKKLRYASDALAGLYGKHGGKHGARSLAGLAALQQDLGALNDLVVAERLLHGLAQSHPEIAFAAGRVVGLLAAAAQRDQATDRRLLRDLAAIKPFWRQPSGR